MIPVNVERRGPTKAASCFAGFDSWASWTLQASLRLGKPFQIRQSYQRTTDVFLSSNTQNSHHSQSFQICKTCPFLTVLPYFSIQLPCQNWRVVYLVLEMWRIGLYQGAISKGKWTGLIPDRRLTRVAGQG